VAQGGKGQAEGDQTWWTHLAANASALVRMARGWEVQRRLGQRVRQWAGWREETAQHEFSLFNLFLFYFLFYFLIPNSDLILFCNEVWISETNLDAQIKMPACMQNYIYIFIFVLF
jgi:hypothetical protein